MHRLLTFRNECRPRMAPIHHFPAPIRHLHAKQAPLGNCHPTPTVIETIPRKTPRMPKQAIGSKPCKCEALAIEDPTWWISNLDEEINGAGTSMLRDAF